jgi:hypothetical protein
MPTGKPKPATPEQIANYGEIARAFRDALANKGWTVAQLNREVYGTENYAATYSYASAKRAPSAATALKLAKALGISPLLLTYDNSKAQREVTEREREQARKLIAPATRPATQGANHWTNKPPDVLNFTVGADGRARIKLDVTLPVAQAMPVLRMIMDAGVAVGTVDDHG